MTNILTAFTSYQQRIEEKLTQTLNTSDITDQKLAQAMAYATLNAGKRLRPILVYLTGESFGQPIEQLDNAAIAIECIHCYSLIHDDLPAMDDDDLRRGKPTCHIAFDEATAILAGDALQSLAFECLSSPQSHTLSTPLQLKMVNLLAKASGRQGMITGQSLDLQAEGKAITAGKLDQIHQLKTGALIKTSILLGAMAADCCDEAILSALGEFGESLGLIFQLQDDLLDTIGDSDKMGKNTGQDAKHQKATYTTLFGETATRERIESLMQNAKSILERLPIDTSRLATLCQSLSDRQY